MRNLLFTLVIAILPVLVQAANDSELLVENSTGYPVDLLYKEEGAEEYTKHVTIDDGVIISQPVTEGFTWYFSVLKQQIIGEYTTTDSEKQRVILDQDVLDAANIPAPPKPKTNSKESGSTLPKDLPPAKYEESPDKPNEVPEKFVSDSDDAPDVEEKPALAAPAPWYDSPENALSFVTQDSRHLNVMEGGSLNLVESAKDKPAMNSAAFMANELPDKKGTYRIQNMYYLDSYLYLPAKAADGTPVLCGPEGENSNTGLWRIEKGQYFYSIINVVNPKLRIGVRDGAVVLSSKSYADQPKELADLKAHQVGDAFFVITVKGYRELMNMVPALTKMADNIKELEDEKKSNAAAREKSEKEAAVREAERRRILSTPEIVSGGTGSDWLTVRPGAGSVMDMKDGGKAIKYSFGPSGRSIVLTADLGTSKNSSENQYMDLNFMPELAAWVQDGELYVGIDTSAETSISLRHGTKPSSSKPTDGNYFIGSVRINAFSPYGREKVMFPTTENREVGAGSSMDQSKGVNFSAEEIMGADFSESKGSNFNFQAKEYTVTGERGPGEPSFGSVQYTWDGTGLSDKVKTTDNRTYETPVDLFDKETLSLRKIPKIAQSLSGLQTRSVFGNAYPVSGLPNQLQLNFDIHVQLHMVQLIKKNHGNTPNKDWEDFKAGFTYIFRPDLWDVNKSFEDQQVIKESQFKPVGFTYDKTFKVFLFVQVDDLKQFMKGYKDDKDK